MLSDSEIKEMAEEIALAGERSAEARKDFNQAQARYRHWRAIAMEDIATRNRKDAEWRVKAACESMQGFANHKEVVDSAREALDICEASRIALLAQAMLLSAMHGHNPALWPIGAQAQSGNGQNEE